MLFRGNMKYAKVKDNPGYIRDMANQAILSSDTGSLASYRKQRQKAAQMNETISDINTMKQEINDIKDMLGLILKKIG